MDPVSHQGIEISHNRIESENQNGTISKGIRGVRDETKDKNEAGMNPTTGNETETVNETKMKPTPEGIRVRDETKEKNESED